MSVLTRWNDLPQAAARAEVSSCCGSTRWGARLCAGRPYASEEDLLEAAREIWQSLEEEDWLEAFRCHPRIGNRIGNRTAEEGRSGGPAAAHATPQSLAWSSEEQAGAQLADEDLKQAVADGNRLYEERFGFIYIVCAAGKTLQEMVEILQRRLGSSRATELREAASQQAQITGLRLKKWLSDREGS